MNRIRTFAAAVLLLLLSGAAPAAAQTELPLDRELRVYLDCTDFHCDDDFFIEEIAWVDFVRDRQVADVHVLGTRRSTGAGGAEYTFEFIGRGPFDGRASSLVDVARPDATEDDRRRGLVRLLRIGLAPFAMATAGGAGLDVAFSGDAQAAAEAVTADDPWNNWVFRISANTFVQGESRQNFMNLNSSVSASRVTDEWKHSLSASGSYDRDYFEIEQVDSAGTVVAADTFISDQRSYGLHALNVKSLTGQWSLGVRSSWKQSDYLNQESQLRLMPAVEYSVFPYAESTRRQFTVLYSVGPVYTDYVERTLFGRTHESLIQQQLISSYDVTQPWGSVELTVGASHFIAQIDDGPEWPEPQYSISSFAEFDVRLFQGLSLNAWGGVDWVRDQIYLPARGQSEREILLQQRKLATNYEYFAQVGLSYTFGSIYSPVVNPRLTQL